MKAKILMGLLVVLVLFFGVELLRMKKQIRQLQTNCAIAVLSAEAANKKIGAVAPYFREDKETFMKAWLDASNLPLPVFPADILDPIQVHLEEARSGQMGLKLRDDVFGQKASTGFRP